MANNTQVQISFISLEIPKNNIVSAFGKFDPTATASFSSQRSTTVPTSPATSGSASLGSISKSLNQPFSASYTQALDTGMSYTVSMGGAKSSFSNSRSTYNPSLTSSMSFSVTQNLIQNRGRYVNRLPIMIAESSYKKSAYNLRATLLSTINAAENVYWNVISARENLKVQEQNRANNESNLKFVQQQLDLGAIAMLDIYNPQGNLAAAEFAVSQAKFRLASAEDALRQQISADLDPEIRKLPIELTEPVDVAPGEVLPLDTEQAVQKAMASNPSVLSAQQQMDVDELGIQTAKNGLLPQLSFTASYSGAGQGGTYIPSQSNLTLVGAAEPIPGGLSDALAQMWGLNNPTYFGRLLLTLPIRSRTAAMTMADSLVTKKTDALNLRNTQQTIRLQTLNAVTNLQGFVEQLKLANQQAEIQQKNYEAEQEKYTLGTDTNQNVVIALTNLVTAQSNVVTAKVALRTGILAVLTNTGELLDARGIVVK
jgi:outer membrane protein TolC